MNARQAARPQATIRTGEQVRLHLAIHLENGEEVLSSFDGEPLCFRLGDGTLSSGLEDLIQDLSPGTEACWQVPGDQVFGPPDPDCRQWLAPEDLPADFAERFLPGQVYEFTTPGGEMTAGTVVEAADSGLLVDFNPPLASRQLAIRIRML